MEENSHLHRINTSTTYISTRRKQQISQKPPQKTEVCNWFVIRRFLINMCFALRQAAFVRKQRSKDDMQMNRSWTTVTASAWVVITKSLKVHLIKSKSSKLCRRSSEISSRLTQICVSITRKPFLDYANRRRQKRRHLRFRSLRDVICERPKSPVTYCWHVN